MRFLWLLNVLVVVAFSPAQRANASTFNLPLNGVVQIVGDLPAPVQVSIVATPNLNGATWLSFSGAVGQSDQISGPFLPLQVCTGGDCFLVAGFFGCAGSIRCAGDPLPGYASPRSNHGEPFDMGPFNVFDSSRFLGIETDVAIMDVSGVGRHLTTDAEASNYIQISIDLPDGLRAVTTAIIAEPNFQLINPTPLPASLPLFVTGLCALGLIGWRRKRNAVL